MTTQRTLLSQMPFVTVEQVVRLREAALKVEKQNAELSAQVVELTADRESLLKMLRLTLDQWKKMNAAAIAKAGVEVKE